MRSPLSRPRAPIALTASVLVAGLVALAQTHTPTPRTISVSEIRPGMRGYGLTVFHGVAPERFDVEVIDVLHDFRPQMDLVLIRPTHPVLAQANTVGGMSGSPIFIDDRLVGAYAYGWEFGSQPVAGVTPIATMLNETRRRRRAPPGLLPGSQVPLPIAGPGERGVDDPRAPQNRARTSAYDRTLDAMRLARAPVATAHGTLAPLSVPLSVAGTSPGAFAHLSQSLAPFGIEAVQASGSGATRTPPDASVPTHFQNGGGVNVMLVSGDVSAASIGTVTLSDEGTVLGFGHPFMSLGETLVPTAIARIPWIVSSVRRSFKLSEPVRPLGALVEDRPSVIIVDEHAEAPTIPVHVHLHGIDTSARPEWNARVAMARGLSPRLAFSVLESALDTAANDSGDLAWIIRSSVTTRTQGVLRFVDVGASHEGLHGFSGTSLATIEALDRLAENPFETVRVDRIEFDVELRWARDFYAIRNVALSRSEADPGERVDLLVSLMRFGAAPEVRRFPITVPRELAGREMEIEVSAGSETVPDMAEPESIGDLVRNLTSAFDEDALVISTRMPGQGVTVRGRLLRELPSSTLDALRPLASSDGGDPIANTRRTVVSLGRIVIGRDRVRLRVRDVRQ